MNKTTRRKWLPEWLPTYQRSDFRGDLAAGLTVGVMLIPQGMAYALLAGMPPIYGLYAGLVPLVVYALLGTSRQLAVGPVAIDALLLLAGISALAEPFSERYVQLVILAGLLIGLLQYAMGLLRLGFLVNFLSHPVIAGFTSAAAIIIAISQLKYILGIPIPRFEQMYETALYAAEHLSQTNLPTLALGLGGIVFILGLRRISSKIPGALLAAILGTAAVAFFHLEDYGVSIVGTVPEGLPGFAPPLFELDTTRRLLPTVLTVTIIGLVESIGIAKVLEAKHRGEYRVDADREFRALGASKIVGSFFQSMPTSASFTRSAVNDDSGARTPVASLITALLIALTLLFFTPLFYFLPQAILASIILVAVGSLFEWEEARSLWRVHRHDFYMLVLTFGITLFGGIETGVFAGVVLSVLMVLWRNSKPHVVVLGQLPDTPIYRNVSRFPEAIEHPGTLVLRFDAPLYFGNAQYFKDTIKDFAQSRQNDLQFLLLDASSISEMDSSGLHALEEVHQYLQAQNIRFGISGLIGPVRDLLGRSGVMDELGHENIFLTIQQGIDAFQNADARQNERLRKAAVQTNPPKKKR